MISAGEIEDYEQCPRRWQYAWGPGNGWELARIRPMQAVHEVLTRYLVGELEQSQIGTAVMQLAGERGVSTTKSHPYDLMRHHAGLAEVLAVTLAREGIERLPSMRYHPPGIIQGSVPGDWYFNSLLMNQGTRLLRLLLVDHWDEDRELRELHSWRTVGDVCVAGLPMTLRVVIVGRADNDGLIRGDWTRARQHPVNKQLRFRRKNSKGDGFAESWKTVFRELGGNISPRTWVEAMGKEGVLRGLVVDRKVRVPEEDQRLRILAEIKHKQGGAWAIGGGAGDRTLLPMHRSACDWPRPCIFQRVCYSPKLITPEEVGCYRKRN